MSEISYRQATLNDAESLTQLRFAFLSEIHDPTLSDPALLQNLRSWFTQRLATNYFKAILALANNDVVACSGLVIHEHPPGIMIPNGREAYIMNMFTLPPYRHRGIATEIFKRTLEIAKDENCTRVMLHALPKARPLYSKFGFKPGDSEMRLDL